MVSKDSTAPGWYSLSAFCGNCQYNAVCPLMTLAEVENCEFVREQRSVDLDRRGRGYGRLLAQTPLTAGSAVVRDRRGHKRELDYAKQYRGRRPLNEHALRNLVAVIMHPEVELPTAPALARTKTGKRA